MEDELPAYPNPEARCELPTCDHTQAEHARVLGLKCIVSSCDCMCFVGPDAAALLEQLKQYAHDHIFR